jgi:heat shock protein HslJ
MKTNKFLITVLSFAILLSACGENNPTDVPQLEGQIWVLMTSTEIQPIDGRKPNLQFEAGQVSGTTGCNHYGGSYQIKGDTIQFDHLYSTEMACLDPEGLLYQERLYLELLGMVDRHELSGDLLTFFTDSQPVLIFKIQTQ